MKSYHEFRVESNDALVASAEFFADYFADTTKKMNVDGIPNNEAFFAALSLSIFKLTDERMEAYHNWLVEQLESTQH